MNIYFNQKFVLSLNYEDEICKINGNKVNLCIFDFENKSLLQ